MRVVYIADFGIEGGATKSLIELVSTMKEKHSIMPIVLTSRRNRLNKRLDELGIENYAVGHGAFMQGAPDSTWKKPIKYVLCGIYYWLHYRPSLKKAKKVIDWSHVDLIHTNVARDDIGVELARCFNIPNICHIREFAELDFQCWSYRHNYLRYFDENVTEFIAISKAVKKYWVDKGLSADKVNVIYNGVNSEKIIPANTRLWKNDKTLKAVLVGGVIPNKGQWQAIEALCMLPDEIDIRLDIIGNYTEAYKEKITEPLHRCKNGKRVSFLGACDDVYDKLKDYHIGLMCSKSEGFGRVTAEYMHAGLAVIASDCGANRELTDNGKCGCLYDRDDTSSLARAMARLYKDRNLLVCLAAAGKNFASNNFTKEINAKNIAEIYRKYTSNEGLKRES